MESLFSLEVIVNFVKLNNLSTASQEATPCLFPCVAFRLLDYPTIAISLLDAYESSEMRQNFKLGQSVGRIARPNFFDELLDKRGRFVFSKGKSCLFRADVDTIRAHLQTTPLYLMLLDTFFEPYKLVGTCLVPLRSLMNEIYAAISEQNTYAPSAKSVQVPCTKITHGVFEIKNLMGDEIGHMSFACRLTSFGTSLIPHVVKQHEKEAADSKSGNSIIQNEEEKADLSVEKEEKVNEIYDYKLIKDQNIMNSKSTNTHKITNSAMVQTLSIDSKDAQVQNTTCMNRVQIDRATQSPETKRKFSLDNLDKHSANSHVIHVRHVQDEFEFNQFCPPVLQYSNKSSSSTASNQASDILRQKSFINQRIEYLNNALENEENFDFEDDEPTKLDKSDSDREYIVKRKPITDLNTKPKLNLDQLPLLNCLFEEISKLKEFVDGAGANNKENEPQAHIFIGQKSLNESRPIEKENRQTLADNLPHFQKVTTAQKKQNKKKLAGILRKTNSNSSCGKLNRKEYDKKAIDEIVNRLSRAHRSKSPSRTQSNENVSSDSNLHSYDETPVKDASNKNNTKSSTKKEPLKYGYTNTFRMRVAANSRSKNALHKERDSQRNRKNELTNSLIGNTNRKNEETSLTSHALDQMTVQKNMEKLFVEMAASTTGSAKNVDLNELNNLIRSLSLLNKVDMDSTIDTMNYQSKLLKSEILNEANKSDLAMSTTDLRQANFSSSTKTVQFGNTYVYDASDNRQTSNDSSSPISNGAKNDDVFMSAKQSSSAASSLSCSADGNIFLKSKRNSKQSSIDYESDGFLSESTSLSSSKKSTSTTSNFFTGLTNKKPHGVDEKSLTYDYDEEFESLRDNKNNTWRSSSKMSDRSLNAKSVDEEQRDEESLNAVK